MRQERHHGHQRQRRMQAAPEQPEPRQAAGAEQIRPEAADAPPPKCRGERHPAATSSAPNGELQCLGRIEQRECQEPESVGGDAKQQQERNDRMLPEDDSRDEIAEARSVARDTGQPSASIGSSSTSTSRA